MSHRIKSARQAGLFFADPQSTGAEGLAHSEVFEIATAHSRSSCSYASKHAQRLMPVIVDWKNEPSGRANMPLATPPLTMIPAQT
jgi:hypothetical protein